MSPAWAGKKRAGWGERFGKGEALAAKAVGKPRILLHAVSVGEVSALRSLVPRLTPHAEVVISVTTDTGTARAMELFGSACRIVRYPLDFSWSVGRFLDRVAPDAVALVELEIWPQFVGACERRGIPVCVINGRLSERSARGYARIRGMFSRSLARLEFAAVQDGAYAERFERLGLDKNKCLLTGSMKWDAAAIEDGVKGAEELAREMGIDRGRPLIVGGSTAEDEEEMLHRVCPAGVQLLCAPRKPEHFEEAARALPGCVRRSKPGGDPKAGRFLLDTIGELRKAYALAEVVVLGRSFGSLFGSDPVEPVALGKATVIGSRHGDFESTVRALRESGGLVVVGREALAGELSALVADGSRRERVAAAGRECIRGMQGASERHAELLLSLVASRVAG